MVGEGQEGARRHVGTHGARVGRVEQGPAARHGQAPSRQAALRPGGAIAGQHLGLDGRDRDPGQLTHVDLVDVAGNGRGSEAEVLEGDGHTVREHVRAGREAGAADHADLWLAAGPLADDRGGVLRRPARVQGGARAGHWAARRPLLLHGHSIRATGRLAGQAEGGGASCASGSGPCCWGWHSRGAWPAVARSPWPRTISRSAAAGWSWWRSTTWPPWTTPRPSTSTTTWWPARSTRASTTSTPRASWSPAWRTACRRCPRTASSTPSVSSQAPCSPVPTSSRAR